jgi:predicted alpha/beta hydrolase family esterase
MKRAVIVHGWDGFPEEGWFPWLKKELELRGYEVRVPAMPDTENPELERWVKHLKKVIGESDNELTLIGHSMGCRTILRYLQSLPENKRVGPVVLVAGWVKLTTKTMTEDEKRIAKQWTTIPADWPSIQSKSKRFTAIFSDNDEWVDSSNADVYRGKLGAEIIIERDKGHFSGSDGVTELPSALYAIIGPES